MDYLERCSLSRGDSRLTGVANKFDSDPDFHVHHCDFANRDEARAAIFDYIECFYNRQRLHQTLDYVSPAQFEQMKSVC